MSLFDRCYYAFWKNLIYYFGKVYWRLRYNNQTEIPREGKLVLIANHQSFLDPPLIGIGMPRQGHYMARDTLFKGLLGWHIRHVNAFPVSHTGSAVAGIKETLRLLKQDKAVLIFPEGTRTEDGKLGEFHKGIISVARRSKAPILPCVIQGAYEAWPRHAKFFKPYPITVTYGKLIPAEQIQEMDEDELLVYLRDTIREMLGEEEN
ncbi:MAG: lysophospholipid acyltransferase family protein [Planctomycetia bacterium]|nr:lysophospholipid acyltransferase family protein [Planctomycetia bacterium]